MILRRAGEPVLGRKEAPELHPAHRLEDPGGVVEAVRHRGLVAEEPYGTATEERGEA